MISILLLAGGTSPEACASEPAGQPSRIPAVPAAARQAPSPALDAARDEGRVAWLREHLLPVRTLDAADEDDSDLRPLAAMLGSSRVVMLGEISHGDGAAFKAKVRLVKYLHRELGFSLLVFESGFYDCAKAWEHLRQGEAPLRAARLGVFAIWSGSEQVAPLWTYLAEQARGPRPLELAGIDDQFTGSAAADLVPDLERFLASHDAASFLATADWSAARDGLTKLASEPEPHPPDAAARLRFRRGLARLAEEIRRGGDGPDHAFWLRVLDDAEVMAMTDWDATSPDRGNRLRDERMAANLVWLARDRHPGAKIVVWAATRHILGDPASIRLAAGDGARAAYGAEATALGREARRSLGDAVFALGFLTSDGTAGRSWEAPFQFSAPRDGSLEDLLRRSGPPLAILDLRKPGPGGEWLRQPLLARPLGYVAMRADWTRSLDAFFFIRPMTPSTRLPAGGVPR